jgi:predicted enzyme related to lactoylglutathione lyase
MTTEMFAFTKLVVGDLDRCAAFYETVCGVKPQARIQGAVGGRAITEIVYEPTNKGGASLVLLAYDDAPRPAFGETIVGFASPDAEAFIARALAAGGAAVEAVRDAPTLRLKVGFVSDPEGHLIEVIERY